MGSFIDGDRNIISFRVFGIDIWNLSSNISFVYSNNRSTVGHVEPNRKGSKKPPKPRQKKMAGSLLIHSRVPPEIENKCTTASTHYSFLRQNERHL